MTDLSTLSPREIDTEIATILTEVAQIRSELPRLTARLDAAVLNLHRIPEAQRHTARFGVQAHNPDNGKFDRETKRGQMAVIALVQETLRDLEGQGVTTQEKIVVGAHAAYEDCLQRAESRHADAEPFEEEFNRRGGWSRFFLVTSSDGHIHRSRSCSTCTWKTTYGWLPDVSGKSDAEAVEAHGAHLCTVCFPTAPVEWTRGNVDPDVCTGSGQYYANDKPKRTGFYSGNWGTCPVCDTRQTITSTGKIRKHKTA